jgi:hypothetical protein
MCFSSRKKLVRKVTTDPGMETNLGKLPHARDQLDNASQRKSIAVEESNPALLGYSASLERKERKERVKLTFEGY